MYTINSTKTDPALKRAPAVSGWLLIVSATARSKDLYKAAVKTCTNYRVGWMRKTTKKRLQALVSRDRNSNPESLEYIEAVNVSMLMFGRMETHKLSRYVRGIQAISVTRVTV
jgi:hypothetical protein